MDSDLDQSRLKAGGGAQVGVGGAGKGNQDEHTSFLLLQRQFRPVSLHAISQRHPEIRLLLRWQGLPSLLYIRKRRVRDSVSFACLRGIDRGSYECSRAPDEGLTKHCERSRISAHNEGFCGIN